MQTLKSEVRSLGLLPSVVYQLQMFRCIHARLEKPLTLYSKYARYPLKCRPYTSDIDVFRQIFIDREYRCLDEVNEPALILDCGANVGLSSAHFLSRFPNSHIVAIEPDPENFCMLERNLAPYKPRYTAIRSAVWSHPAGLVMSEEPFGDRREWARTVREIRDGEEPAMTAVDIGTLLKDSGYDRISILKMDLEGAESVVFSAHYDSWVDKVDNLVVELHSKQSQIAFRNILLSSKFRLTHCDELVVCKRCT
jgi:FkbM family methyltransferase